MDTNRANLVRYKKMCYVADILGISEHISFTQLIEIIKCLEGGSCLNLKIHLPDIKGDGGDVMKVKEYVRKLKRDNSYQYHIDKENFIWNIFVPFEIEYLKYRIGKALYASYILLQDRDFGRIIKRVFNKIGHSGMSRQRQKHGIIKNQLKKHSRELVGEIYHSYSLADPHRGDEITRTVGQSIDGIRLNETASELERAAREVRHRAEEAFRDRMGLVL